MYQDSKLTYDLIFDPLVLATLPPTIKDPTAPTTKMRKIAPEDSSTLQRLREFTGYPFEGLLDEYYYLHAVLVVDIKFGVSIIDSIFKAYQAPNSDSFEIDNLSATLNVSSDHPIFKLSKHLLICSSDEEKSLAKTVFVIPKINVEHVHQDIIKPLSTLIKTQQTWSAARLEKYLKVEKMQTARLTAVTKLINQHIKERNTGAFIKAFENIASELNNLELLWKRMSILPHLSSIHKNQIELCIPTLNIIKQLQSDCKHIGSDLTAQQTKHSIGIWLQISTILSNLYEQNNRFKTQLNLGFSCNFAEALLISYQNGHFDNDDFDINFVEKLMVEALKEIKDDSSDRLNLIYLYSFNFYVQKKMWSVALQNYDYLIGEVDSLSKKTSQNKTWIYAIVLAIYEKAVSMLDQLLVLNLETPENIKTRAEALRRHAAKAQQFCQSTIKFNAEKFIFIKEICSKYSINILFEKINQIIHPVRTKKAVLSKSAFAPSKKTIPEPELAPITALPVKIANPPEYSCFFPPSPTIHLPKELQQPRKKKKKKNNLKSSKQPETICKAAKQPEEKVYYLRHPFYKNCPEHKNLLPAILALPPFISEEITQVAIKILDKGIIGDAHNEVKIVDRCERKRYGLASNVCYKIKGQMPKGSGFHRQEFRIDGGWETHPLTNKAYIFFRTLRQHPHDGPKKSTTPSKEHLRQQQHINKWTP